MKIITMLLVLFSIQAFADNNIISVTIGVESPETQTTSESSSSSSTTTTTNNGHNHGHGNGHHKHHSTSTTINNNTVPSTSSSPTQMNNKVFGLQYQRRLKDSPIWLGVLIQTNQTYSISYGIGF